MDRSNVIKLIKGTKTKDEIGQLISAEIERQVYCDVWSIQREEWAEAGRNGFRPMYDFVIFAPDYEGEKIVEYEGKRYGVYRTYIGKNERIHLYSEAKGGV